MAYNIEELKSKYGYAQPTSAPQPGSSYDVEALKKKYVQTQPTPVTTNQPTPYQARVSPIKGFAGAVDNALNPLVNAGEGATLSIANTGLGILGGVSKLVGADKFAAGVEDFRQQGFVKPTENSQKTFSGKTGKVVTDVASYMIPGGLPARIATNTAVGFGQSGGDVKAGLASGVIEAIGGPLSKLPVAKKFVGKVARTLAPGYTTDIVQGLSGQRGEDRTGVNALIPGAGTAFSAVLGTGIKAANTIQKVRKVETQLNARAKEWEVPARNKTGAFDKAKDIQERAKGKGLDMTKEISEQGFERKNYIVDNKLDTKKLVEKVRKEAGQESAFLDEATKRASPRVLREPSIPIYEQAIKNIDSDLAKSVEGKAIINRIRKEAALQNTDLDFNDLYKKKQFYGKNAKWKFGMAGDGIKEKANAELNKVFKEKLLQKGKEANVPVDDFLKMQEKQYLVADYLNELDGTKVYKTPVQIIRRGILKAGGAILGAKGGLYGSVAGYQGGGVVDKLISNFPTPIRNAMLKDYQRATPSAKTEMIKVIQKMVNEQKTIKKLPSSQTIYQGPTQGGKPFTPNTTGAKTSPVVETANYSNQRSVAIPNNIPNTTIPIKAIPKTIPQKLTNLQKQNLKVAQKLDNEALINFGGKDGTAVRTLQEIEQLDKSLNFPAKLKTIPPIKKTSKQSGMIRNPLVSKMKIHSEDLGEMRDFLDVQTGAYKPSEKMILDNEIAVRRYVEDKFGKNTDNLNPKALARYIGPIVDKYYGK